MPYRPMPRIIDMELRIESWKHLLKTTDFGAGIDHKSLTELEHALYGHVVLPGDPSYEQDRQENNTAFQAYPQIIVYCVVPDDVRACLQFAQAHDLWVACRSGGHSTAGYSVNSGMVIDVSQMNSVCVDPQRKLARVGAGTNFGRLNAHLNGYGLHVPGGACETVCVAGYMQGGGYGYTSRKFGMNCDNVESFRMMLRDGRIVTASPREHHDLFWAVRGGTGGNFGVLLDITYHVHKLDPVWGFARVWEGKHAAALMHELQANYMRSGAPSELGYMGNVAHHHGQLVFVLQGLFIGDPQAGNRALESLSSIATPVQELETVLPYAKMDTWLDNSPYPVPDVPNVISEDKQAGYIDRPLSVNDWQDVVDQYTTTPFSYNTLVIEPYGGAITEGPQHDNAFIHRDVDMDLFVDVFWRNEIEKKQSVDWLNEYMAFMEKYFNGRSYQNYPRRTLKDYRRMYFGHAFDRLLSVKDKYDPQPYFFNYQQSIKPYDYQSTETEQVVEVAVVETD